MMDGRLQLIDYQFFTEKPTILIVRTCTLAAKYRFEKKRSKFRLEIHATS
jgi:hypothetical protein